VFSGIGVQIAGTQVSCWPVPALGVDAAGTITAAR